MGVVGSMALLDDGPSSRWERSADHASAIAGAARIVIRLSLVERLPGLGGNR